MEVLVPSTALKAAKELQAVDKAMKVVRLEIAASEKGLELAHATNVGSKAALIQEASMVGKASNVLERSVIAEGRAATVVEGAFSSDAAATASIEKFKKAQSILEPHKGKYFSELEARGLNLQAGIETPPRPTGIPENFRIKLSDTPGGLIYQHSENNHISIRLMPGKPHSPFPYQQKPYVIYKRHGKTLDKLGNVVDPTSTEAHILLEEFVYRE